MMLVLSDAYRRQYGFDSCVPVIANLYGPEDNFDLEDSHVIAAMIAKFVGARQRAEDSGHALGDGLARRASSSTWTTRRERCCWPPSGSTPRTPVNVGTGQETRIRDLAELIARPDGVRGRDRLGQLEAGRAAHALPGRVPRPLADGFRGRGAARGGAPPDHRELPRKCRSRLARRSAWSSACGRSRRSITRPPTSAPATARRSSTWGRARRTRSRRAPSTSRPCSGACSMPRGLREEDLEGKAILELGPGDNLGLALRFIAAGAERVVTLDKFAVPRDPAHEQAIYRELTDRLGEPQRARAEGAFDSGRIRDARGTGHRGGRRRTAARELRRDPLGGGARARL